MAFRHGRVGIVRAHAAVASHVPALAAAASHVPDASLAPTLPTFAATSRLRLRLLQLRMHLGLSCPSGVHVQWLGELPFDGLLL